MINFNKYVSSFDKLYLVYNVPSARRMIIAFFLIYINNKRRDSNVTIIFATIIDT